MLSISREVLAERSLWQLTVLQQVSRAGEKVIFEHSSGLIGQGTHKEIINGVRARLLLPATPVLPGESKSIEKSLNALMNFGLEWVCGIYDSTKRLL